MKYTVTLYVNYQQVVTVEAPSILHGEELARAQVAVPNDARGFVAVQNIEFEKPRQVEQAQAVAVAA